MGDLANLDTITKLDLPAERILNYAQNADLQSAVVIGYTEDGEFYFASSLAAGPEVLWLMELARTRLIDTAEELACSDS